MRLLLVEDSTALRESLATALSGDGHVLDTAADGEAALAFLAGWDYELVVLDLMLPRLDGFEVLRRLRHRQQPVRVLVLSARDRVEDRVRALELGADDYLVKPFALDELLARIRALGRRSLTAGSPRLEAGQLSLDPERRLANGPRGVIALSPKEYALLELLLRGRGRVHARGELFERLYDSRSAASDKVIEVLMSTLRGKLVKAGAGEPIQTRRGFGYVIQ